MEINKKDVGWRLWIQWVLAYSLSIAIGIRIATRLPRLIYGNSIEDALYQILGWLIYGLIVGLAQWFVLSQHGISKWWIPITAMSVVFFVSIDGFLLVSVPQSLILWRRTRWAGLWIIAHLPTFLFLMEFRIKIFQVMPDNWLYIDRMYIPYLIGGVMGAMISGFALIWLLRHPKTESPACGEVFH